MRLIDATIQPQFLTDYILERKSTFIRVLEKGDNDFLFGLIMDYFDKQLTAYDVDKVVGRLEETKAYMLYENMNADVKWIDKAIEIVKAGGKNDN